MKPTWNDFYARRFVWSCATIIAVFTMGTLFRSAVASAETLCPGATNNECFEAEPRCGNADEQSLACWCTHCESGEALESDQYFCAPLDEHRRHEASCGTFVDVDAWDDIVVDDSNFVGGLGLGQPISDDDPPPESDGPSVDTAPDDPTAAGEDLCEEDVRAPAELHPAPEEKIACCTFSNGWSTWKENVSCDDDDTYTECCDQRAVGAGIWFRWTVKNVIAHACGHETDCQAYLCNRETRMGCAADWLTWLMGAYHQWVMIKCDDGTVYESGLGPVGGGVPGQGNDEYAVPPYGPQTSWNDHAGEHLGNGAVCYGVNGCDMECVRRKTRIGKRMGNFCAPVITSPPRLVKLNQCNQVAHDALVECGCQDRCLERDSIGGCVHWALDGYH